MERVNYPCDSCPRRESCANGTCEKWLFWLNREWIRVTKPFRDRKEKRDAKNQRS